MQTRLSCRLSFFLRVNPYLRFTATRLLFRKSEMESKRRQDPITIIGQAQQADVQLADQDGPDRRSFPGAPRRSDKHREPARPFPGLQGRNRASNRRYQHNWRRPRVDRPPAVGPGRAPHRLQPELAFAPPVPPLLAGVIQRGEGRHPALWLRLSVQGLRLRDPQAVARVWDPPFQMPVRLAPTPRGQTSCDPVETAASTSFPVPTTSLLPA